MTINVAAGKFFAAALTILTALSGAPAKATGRCSGLHGLAVRVTVQSVPLSMRTDFSAAEIAAMAPGQHRHDPLGFYRNDVGYRLATHVSRPRGEPCPQVTVDAELVEIRRDIEIARDLRENQCRMHAVVEHYKRHADASEAALRRVARQVQARLRGKVVQSFEIENNEPALDDELRGKLGAVLDEAVTAFSKAAPAIRDAVDAQFELSKTFSACSST